MAERLEPNHDCDTAALVKSLAAVVGSANLQLRWLQTVVWLHAVFCIQYAGAAFVPRTLEVCEKTCNDLL